MIKNEQERQRIGQHIARIEAGRYSVGLDTLTAIGQALGKRLAFV